jgi:hypothetical protein
MSIKHMYIPAVAACILFVGCGNKPSEQVPTTAPEAAKEPFEILKNIQYLGVKKDLSYISVVSLTDLNVAYAAAIQLHKHAGSMGIVLRDQDIMDLGVTDLRTKGYLVPGVAHSDLAEAQAKATTGVKMLPWMAKLDIQKLDLLPETDTLADGKPNPEYQEIRSKYALPAMKAGVFRVISGVPEGMWPKLAVMETKPDPQSSDAQDVFIGFKGTPVMQVAVMKNKSGNYGIFNIVLKFSPKKLMSMLGESK